MLARRLALVSALAAATVTFAPSSAGAYLVTCKDGTTSDAGGKQGACSYHGGVATTGGTSTAPTPATSSTDFIPPNVTVTAGFGSTPSTVAVGKPTPPVGLELEDLGGFPSNAAVVIRWGDGSTSPVGFTPNPAAPYTGYFLTVPGHIYGAPGKFIPVAATVDAAGNVGNQPLAPVTVMAPPTQTTLSRAAGTPRVGRTLTCKPGSWTGDAEISEIWLANGHLIPGSEGPTFQARPRDRGRHLACLVTAENQVGTATAKSAAVLIGARRR